MRVVVIIPTFNERGNIGRLIERLQASFATLPHEMLILVVDDHSPDGTMDAVRACQRRWPNVHALQHARQGLGGAYVRGMRHALDVLGAEALLQMDADFSHDPADVPRLLAPLAADADLVIGSRYVAGGTVADNWSTLRRLASRWGNAMARYLAGMYRIRDCTAGFRAIRSEVIRRIALEELRVQGYAFQIALLHAAVVAGARVVEIPVDFVDRTEGESKLGLRDIAEFLYSAAWIRFQGAGVFLRFCVVGASGVLVNVGTFSVLLALGVNRYLASPLAIVCSIFSNFLGNNYWTFRRRELRGALYARGLRFNAVSLLALTLSYGTFVVLSRALPAGAPQLQQLLAIIPATVVNYFLNSYWTFGDAARHRERP
ncbi:MAG TPA: glycosyltransferase family 2 protein [Steroidobacteraceae bacterium]|nr:glycosyltransferase family 2 protein [Steroidobacteraceae bacterium]